MSDRIPARVEPSNTEVMDHAREFVRIVLERTPRMYAELQKLPAMRQRLLEDNAFNLGKLYAWAEYLVFRAEFLDRFPDASRSACINAFSGLFLKNDISMTNLAAVMEPSSREELTRLERKPGKR